MRFSPDSSSPSETIEPPHTLALGWAIWGLGIHSYSSHNSGSLSEDGDGTLILAPIPCGPTSSGYPSRSGPTPSPHQLLVLSTALPQLEHLRATQQTLSVPVVLIASPRPRHLFLASPRARWPSLHALGSVSWDGIVLCVIWVSTWPLSFPSTIS